MLPAGGGVGWGGVGWMGWGVRQAGNLCGAGPPASTLCGECAATVPAHGEENVPPHHSAVRGEAPLSLQHTNACTQHQHNPSRPHLIMSAVTKPLPPCQPRGGLFST